MKGLELSERFYLEYGVPMIKNEFADVEKYLAFGLVGSGSECLGFDDEISQDHDFEPGFCIFLPDEDVIDSRTAFRLERAYAKLPKTFLGYQRQPLSPVGGNRHGVIRIGDFFRDKVGDPEGIMSVSRLFAIEEQFLLEATGGKIFCDNLGLITDIRRKLSYYPEDIRLKKLSGNRLIMAQSGQYNYRRCLDRYDEGGCAMCMCEFVKSATSTVFLLNRCYKPYYKWVFRALGNLAVLSDTEKDLEMLISSGNSEGDGQRKTAVIEDICRKVADVVRSGISLNYVGNDLERCAYKVNDMIKDNGIRNLNILCAV